ncbi:MAG: NAD(P)-dependent glycerol-3-phosphate dehydrogenase [Candidatus Omnitrophica bacterium]|nr:NAD(P)-dependent glycerol-3-phosphate dehydrogenase [Candidatus Omnitrophota bacterium]
MVKKLRIFVLGDGGWGTTLALLLDRTGFPVTLWSAFSAYARYLDTKRRNPKFLPGVTIPRRIRITDDIAAAAASDVIVLAVPSEYLRQVLRRFKKTAFPRRAYYASVVKGIELGSLKRMSEVIHEELGAIRLGVLSGPTIVHEVVAGLPTTAVIASRSKKTATALQDIFMNERFRIYTSNDVTGVELGGSLKNVIAIACGISDGLGFGTNAKAALVSRGLAEMARLGSALGAEAKTFSGISGLGDLVTTCFSAWSRNRSVGEQIAKGKTLAQVRKRMQMVAEGVPTAQSAFMLGKRSNIELPITEQVYAVLYRGKSPLAAVSALMTRAKREE